MAAISIWLILPVDFRDMVIGRFELTFDENVDLRTVTAGRSMLLEIGWGLWQVSPIIGHGWAAFSNLVGGATHNVYLEYLVNLGLIGFVLFILLWYRIVQYFLRTKAYCINKSQIIIINGLLAGVIGLLVAIMFVNLYKPWLFVWSFIGLGMAYATRIRVHKAKKLASSSNKPDFYYSSEPVEG
jgi:O-antigen ligase